MRKLVRREFLPAPASSAKYIASTYANEVIVTGGVVRAKTAKGDGYRFTVDVWAANEVGEKKTVGVVEVDVGVQNLKRARRP